MSNMKKYLTARRLSLSLILVLAGMMFLSTLIPQTMDLLAAHVAKELP